MQPIHSWLNAAAIRQDYLWFLVAAGWIVLLMLAKRADLPGIVGLGLASIAHAVGEIAGLLILTDSTGEPAVISEAVFVVIAGLASLALLVTGLWRRRGMIWGGIALLLGSMLLIAAAAGRIWLSETTAHALLAVGLSQVVIASMGLGGIVSLQPYFRDKPAAAWWLAVLLMLVVAPVFATSGFIAEISDSALRWHVASPIGLLSVVWQLSILGVAFVAWRRRSALPTASPRLDRGGRLAAGLIAGWLGLGVLLVEVAGRGAEHTFNAALQARARTCLSALDRAQLGHCLGPVFRLAEVKPSRNPKLKGLIADAPVTLSPAFYPLRRALQLLLKENPDFGFVFVKTLRQGWVTGAVLPWTEKPIFRGLVNIYGPVTSADLARWAKKEAYVDGPVSSPRGTLLEVGEPVLGAGGEMRGWLTIVVDGHYLLAAQAPARMLACLTVAMGSVVAGGFIVLRARSQAQREAAAQASAALAADRLKSALLAHVSHELRTPLQGILGYAELLAGHPLDEEQRGWLSAQRRQGELLLRLVNDLIDLGALQSGAFTCATRSAPLTPLVEETVLSLRPRAHLRKLSLELDTDPALPAWLVFDPDRVRQVLLNLVGNALKFTTEGGVVVRLRRVALDADAAVVEIAVADTGPGIAAEDQARLFRPFTRLEATRHHEGAGLGLALAHGLCGAMGGALTVESDGRTGTTFRAQLRLPLGTAPAIAGGETAAPVAAHAGLRLVVADDNALVRELYLAHLSSQGAVCRGAIDGTAAVAAVHEELPDVLLLDLAMPQLDGLAVARQLREEGHTRLRIIGISAHGNPDYRQRALAAGMDDFLVKPVRLGELSRCVQRHTGSSSPAPHSAVPQALQEKLHALFVRETPALLDELTQALRREDWETVEARAHYLKNSAWVLGDTVLSEHCEALCAAARARDLATLTTLRAALPAGLTGAKSPA